MVKPRSLFGINLLAQFVLFLLLAGLAGRFPLGLRELFGLAGSLLFTIFLFGLLYALFHALGARSGGLEWFYQRFPCGFFMEGTDVSAEEMTMDDGMGKIDATRNDGFDWRNLCSFQTLRYAGIILIITAVFSLLFTIDWQLLHKVLVSAGLGLLSMVGAELLTRSGRGRLSMMLSLIGFSLLQFSLTLLSLYATEQGWAMLLQNPHTWLTLKFLLTCATLFTLWRYPSDIHPLLYFAVAYVSPLSLLYAGSSIDFPIGLVFTALLTAIVLAYGSMHRRPSLFILNAIAANVFTYFLFTYEVGSGGNAMAAATLALIAYAAFFTTHLTVAVIGAQTEEPLDRLEYLHLVLLQVFACIGVYLLRDAHPLVFAYHGFAYVIVGLASFFAYFAGGSRMRDRLFRELLLNLAILFSTIGLFVQTTGPWSGVLFLLYACAVLWFSLHTPTIRTRVYGFIILFVSLIKLYLQFSEIFQSIPGSLAVLGIGVILVVLSFRFEALKGLVLHGLPSKMNDGEVAS